MNTGSRNGPAGARFALWLMPLGGALLTAGCLGGSSSSSNGTDAPDPAPSTVTAENAGYVSRLGDGLVRGGGALDGLAGTLAAGNMQILPAGQGTAQPAAAALQASETTEDCPTSGTWSRTETDEEVLVRYEACVADDDSVRHEADGAVHIEQQVPEDDYTEAQRFAFDEMRLSVSRHGDTQRLQFDGWIRNDRRDVDDYRQTVDFSLQQTFHCKGQSLALNATQDFVTVVEPGAPGRVITVTGTGSTTGNPRFEGALTVETLDPVRIEDAGGHPYQGELRLTAEDGSHVVLRYVEGGVFVDDDFYTWSEYNNAFIDDFVSDLGCFTEEPIDPGPIAEGMRATINGTAWSADPVVSNATLGGPLNALTVHGLDPSSLSNYAIGLNLQEMTGPGTYTLSLPGDELQRFGTVTIAEGDLRWDSFVGEGGTITVLSVGGGRVSGTFSFIAGPQQTSDATGTVIVTDGEFNLPLHLL